MSMRSRLILVAILATSLSFSQGVVPSLDLLKRCMVGSFSNAAQVRLDTACPNVETELRRIWLHEPEGIWLYEEQALATSKSEPYRQRILHLTERPDSTFSISVHGTDSMHLFIGAYKDIARFNAFGPKDAKPIAGCELVLSWRNSRFTGGTRGTGCKDVAGNAAYVERTMDIGPNDLVIRERAFDEDHTLSGGATKEGYQFVKKRPSKAVPAAANE